MKTMVLLFEPGNADDLATTLIRMIKDKQLREKLALNGAQTVQDYDIRAVAPKMSQIYRSVIKKLVFGEVNDEF